MSNYLDTRDLYKRQCELQSLCDAVKDASDELAAHRALARPEDEAEAEEYDREIENLEEAHSGALAEFGDEEREELEELDNLESEVGSEWMHGETMIPEHRFNEYAEELAADTCDMKRADVWPFRHIDWEAASDELKQDYSEVEYQGATYLVHSC